MSRVSHVARSVFAFVMVALFLGGCQGPLTARHGRPDRGFSFRSPLEPINVPIRSPETVRRVLAQRSRPVQGLKARLEILMGEGARRNPRQRLEALVYVDPPDFMRLRASQNGAVVLDLLVDGDDATALVVPERMAFRGSLHSLEENTRLTGGLAPSLIFEIVNIESSLAARLRKENVRLELGRETLTLVMRGARASEVEQYVLRSADVLVQRKTRWLGRRKVGEVRFWAYEKMPDGGVVPTDFVIENALGGAALVRMRDLRLNEPRTPALASLEIPPGFEVRDLSSERP